LGWTSLRGGDGGYVRVDRATPNTVYHEYQQTVGSGFLERSDDGGMTWAPKTAGINFAEPANFYVPYVMDPSSSSRLLLGTTRIYETTNRADNWTAISSVGLGGWNPGGQNVDAIGLAPGDANTIYAATGGLFATSSQIYVTSNHGSTWAQRNLPS